jgi:hypothetical protein
MSNDSYEVGYGRPPKSNQFRSGSSGNPKGRPRGKKNLSAILKELGQEKVQVKSDGRERMMTRIEVAIRQLHNKAASGDLRAINLLLGASRMFAEEEQLPESDTSMHERDRKVLENLLKRMQSVEAEVVPPKEPDEES